jgi:hypothetical protein
MQRTKWTMDERKSSSSSSARPRAFGFSGIDVDVIERLPAPHPVILWLSTLQSMHDVVILAYGTQSSDRRQGIPGSGDGELDGVLSAREFMVWYNGHPEFGRVGDVVGRCLWGGQSTGGREGTMMTMTFPPPGWWLWGRASCSCPTVATNWCNISVSDDNLQDTPPQNVGHCNIVVIGKI